MPRGTSDVDSELVPLASPAAPEDKNANPTKKTKPRRPRKSNKKAAITPPSGDYGSTVIDIKLPLGFDIKFNDDFVPSITLPRFTLNAKADEAEIEQQLMQLEQDEESMLQACIRKYGIITVVVAVLYAGSVVLLGFFLGDALT